MRQADKRSRNRFAKELKRLCPGGDLGKQFGALVRRARNLIGAGPAERRKTESLLRHDAGYARLGFGRSTDAIDRCIQEHLQKGSWRGNHDRWNDFNDLLGQVRSLWAPLEPWLEHWGFLDREHYWLSERWGYLYAPFDAAIFTNYDGAEYAAWVDYLLAHRRRFQTFVIAETDYGKMPPAFHLAIWPERRYVDITDVAEADVPEFTEWLKEDIQRRRQRSDAASARKTPNEFPLALPPGWEPQPKEKRGRAAGASAKRPERTVEPWGRSWGTIALEILRAPEVRRSLKAEYMKYWEGQMAEGRSAPSDPAKNFDTQVSRHLQRLGR